MERRQRERSPNIFCAGKNYFIIYVVYWLLDPGHNARWFTFEYEQNMTFVEDVFCEQSCFFCKFGYEFFAGFQLLTTVVSLIMLVR